MDLNLCTNANGETAAIGALKLTIDLRPIDFQSKAISIGVKSCIRFLLVILLIINNRVVIFTTTPNTREDGNKTK
jgi:hypothetical protein